MSMDFGLYHPGSFKHSRFVLQNKTRKKIPLTSPLMPTTNTVVPFATKCKHLPQVWPPLYWLCTLCLFTCFSCFGCRLGLAFESAPTVGTLALLPSVRQGAALFLPPAASLAVVPSISGAGRGKSRTRTEGLVSLKYVTAKRCSVLRMGLRAGRCC